jgi:zinc protease
VLKHAKPEHRAALWLAVDAGSVLEDDDQRGLAHFVEHMAFNGTRRFPKLDIVNYIEHSGMKFGADVNAYTSFDQTVYQLTVPTDDRAVMLQGLDVLRDMAGDITFDPVEVDKERGVVLEEWRQHQGAAFRLEDQRLPILFAGSRYAQRLTIGLPDVIKTAKREALVRFYKDWYRPDLMAVIATGDFDPAAVEAEIKARFADLAGPTRPRERAPVPVPHDHPPAVMLATDPEARFTTVAIYDKRDHRRMITERDLRTTLIERLYHAMFTTRLIELRDEPRSPLVAASSERRTLTHTADAVTRAITVREGRLVEGLRLLVRELARLEHHGFLPSELDRARKTAIARYERICGEYAKAPLREVAGEIVRNFVDDELMPGPEVELAWAHEILPAITLDEVNALAMQHAGEAGRVIAISAPAGATLPSEAEVLALAATEAKATLSPWRDSTPDEPLLATAPTPGAVATTDRLAAAGATVWTLGNGIRVIVKPTAFSNDTVVLDGWQPGGTSRVPDADFVHARFADEIIPHSGAGKFSERAIHKLLAGTSIALSIDLDERAERVSGTTRSEDLETMLQLLYLRLTQPRHDRTAFDIWKAKRLEAARHRADSPELRYTDELVRIETADHPRRRPVTTDMIEQVDLAKVASIWADRLSDLGGFTFVIVGNVDLATLQPLVASYLGSLPAKGRKAAWKDVGIKRPATKIEKTVLAGTEPKSRVHLSFGAPAKYTLDGEHDAEILSATLRIRLRELLREDMGGVYNVSVGATLSREPSERRYLAISFGCAPENVDKLRDAVFAELASIAKSGIGNDVLTKVSEQFRRQHETELAEDQWWASVLREASYYHTDLARLIDIDGLLARVTSARVQATAKRMFDPKRYILVVLSPGATPARP